jgi:predicted RNA binding protein YcfA (HicA-like mRNA interferase family)
VTKLPVVSGAEVIRALQRDGFISVSTRGSHHKLHHPERGATVIVPLHRRALL